MCAVSFTSVIIFSVLLILSIFDVITSISYTCDRHAPCGCSQQSTVMFSKIIGGEPVYKPHLWEWIASLRRDGLHQCGSSLISASHVITAAHCVKDIISLSRLSLNFGITNLSNIGQLRNVTKMYIHPLYDEGSSANDLAILRLDKAINLTDSNISIICLPATSDFNLEQAEYPPVGDQLVAIGWGSTDPFIRIPSPILRQVTIQAIAKTDPGCANAINDDAVQFCAGFPDGGKDTCQGDSGGPLMIFKDDRWQLVGITSYGEICGAPGFPGIYTRVAYYESFINEIIHSNDSFIPNPRQMNAEPKPRSNAKHNYEKSMIQLVFICLFIVDRQLFYNN